MVGIEGIIPGAPDPASPTRAGARELPVGRRTESVQDTVLLSPEGQAASRVVQRVDPTELEIERIARAKRNIEQGAHRLQSVLRQVAARVSRYIEVG